MMVLGSNIDYLHGRGVVSVAQAVIEANDEHSAASSAECSALRVEWSHRFKLAIYAI